MRLSLKLLSPALLSLASLSTLACVSDDDPIGPGNDDDVAELEPACEESVTVLEGVDDLSPEGYAAADILDLALGSYEQTLSWVDQEGEVKVTLEPAEATKLFIDLASVEGEQSLRYVASAPNEAALEAGAELECRSRIEADALLNIATANGALAEELEVVLRAEIEDEGLSRPHIRESLALEELAGSLQMAAIEPADPSALDFVLEIRFPGPEDDPALGSTGRIGGWAEYSTAEGEEGEASMTEFTLAQW